MDQIGIKRGIALEEKILREKSKKMRKKPIKGNFDQFPFQIWGWARKIFMFVR